MIQTPCVEYTGERNRQGYGRQWRNNARHAAHRLAYCDANNLPIQSIAGLVVRHKCDNPSCINPDHLEIGTHQDNYNDCIERGRMRTLRGHDLPQTLPVTKVQEVLDLLATGMSQRSIASRCRVSQSTVSRILNKVGAYANT